MKLTQNDIATIEQAHDYLLDKVKLRFDVPLLSKLRYLSSGMINKIDNVNDELFVLSKKEILQAYKSPDKLKEFAKDAFMPKLEVGKWYMVSFWSLNPKPWYIYITEFTSKYEFMCFGFSQEGSFFGITDSKIVDQAIYTRPEKWDVHKLFRKEAKKRGYNVDELTHATSFIDKCEYRIDGKLVFNNGFWIYENADINNFIDKAKELEKKHSLKITVTFE